MNLYKILFEHDIEWNQVPNIELATPANPQPTGIEEFFTPSLTFSKFVLDVTTIDGAEINGERALDWQKIMLKTLSSSQEKVALLPENLQKEWKEIQREMKNGKAPIFAKAPFRLIVFCTKNHWEELCRQTLSFMTDREQAVSMNGKRVTTENIYYFERSKARKLPHGIEPLIAGYFPKYSA